MAVPISKDFLYTEILGIPRYECPPSHYRLLGLNNFERDPATIQAAIDERVRLIQQTGLATQAEALVRHVQEVGNLLLTPHLKEAYDGILLQQTVNSSPPGDYPLNPAYPPAPYAGQHDAGQHDAGQQGTYAPSTGVGRANPVPRAASPTGAPAPATATTRIAKPRPKLKRSRVYVPVWARVLIIMVFIAAHGAIYWYAYDYLNRPSEASGEVTIKPEQSGPENVTKGASLVPATEQNIPATNPSAPGANNRTEQPLVIPGNSPASNSVTSPAPGSQSLPRPSTSDPFGSMAPPPIKQPLPSKPKPQPFSQLKPYIGLPQLNPQTSTQQGATQLGTLAENIANQITLAIESSAVNLAGRRFDLVSTPTHDTNKRTWDVKLVAPTETDPNQGKSIGHLYADDSGSLKFHWNANALPDEAAQLQNTMLLCSHAEHQHTMALRVPESLPAIGINLAANDLTTTVSLVAPPAIETLRMSVDFDEEISVPIVAEPADRTSSIGEYVLLTLGASDDVVRGELRVVTKQNGGDQIQLSVLPKYRQKDDGKLQQLNQESLVSQISRLRRLLSRDAEDLAAAYTNLPTHLANMKKLQASVPRDKDQAGAKARTLLQLEGYIKKCQSTIRAKTRTMPASYEALHRIIEAARLGRKLDNKTTLQYRLFAQTPSGPLLLAQGINPVSRDKSTDGFSFLDNTPGPAGTWVKLKPEMQIVTLSAGGSIRVTDASGTRSVGSGTWRKSGDLIHISLSGSSGDFKFYNGVALATEDGAALFRKF